MTSRVSMQTWRRALHAARRVSRAVGPHRAVLGCLGQPGRGFVVLFVGRCGGTVVCVDACLAEAGLAGSPDPTAVLVSPIALAISVEVTRFTPFETKRFMFDFHIGTDRTRYALAAGTFVFNGSYGAVRAPLRRRLPWRHDWGCLMRGTDWRWRACHSCCARRVANVILYTSTRGNTR